MKTRPITLSAILLITAAFPINAETFDYPIKSSFDATKVTRNPFERIDAKSLVERNSTVAPPTSKAEDLKSQFSVTAVCIDRLAIAVINKKAFAESEWFKLKTPTKSMWVQVLKVKEDVVQLDCEGTVITIPISRQKPSIGEQQ